ncbi:MAG: type II toxin-antitoxin system RelE/ParE family toxin [Alphaproteobacteria bacterium]|nr:type II toxin-antitoxin system RelE/ParE family toxin [Alphaproteobacteria bacterium]
MPTILAPAALADLEGIDDYIAADNPRRAASFIDELEIACRQIAEQPKAYPRRPALGPGARVRFYRDYAIIYRIERNAVHILRVVQGSRDLEALMAGDLNRD